ncbi:MAG: acyl carrier protein, partial [Candidatus Latescibacterota bacterium]|nr:acyl carrier protein [Candidatus Latescibacterota bacterium]
HSSSTAMPRRSCPTKPRARREDGSILNRDDVKARVYKVIAQVLKIEESQIDEANSFTADLGAESVQSVELMAGFEEEFDIEMDEDEALEVQNVGGAIDFIGRYLD